MQEDLEIAKRGRFFRDPYIGDEVLRLGVSSIACTNIRDALRQLGYTINFDTNQGQDYDNALAQQILQFQIDHQHSSQDGLFGPGTRHLLTKVLLERRGPRAFGHMRDPEKYTFPDRDPDVIRKEITHRYSLIDSHKSRLQVLEVQAASFGPLHVPAYISTEIDAAKSIIRSLEGEINTLKQKLD
jgi:hypothetical protein